jgi:predicted HAD superfamily Cof-like phosphohydrolase
MDLQNQAEEFRFAYDVEDSIDNANMQLRLIYEEFQELRSAHMSMMEYEPEGALPSNEAETLKELADLVYVCYQYAANMQWDLNTTMQRVHESNMSKLGEDGKPIRRVDGKILKGPNYKPPYLEDLCHLI